jgi:hypothetical protein
MGVPHGSRTTTAATTEFTRDDKAREIDAKIRYEPGGYNSSKPTKKKKNNGSMFSLLF